MAVEFRTVNQDHAFKVLKRDYVWKDETRGAASDYDAARVVQIYGTDESVDRHNTIFRVDGWDFDDYRKNPVFLWAHNSDPAVSMMPLGRTIGIQREEFQRAEGSKTDKRLLFDVEFPKRGTYPFADLAHDMYKEGFLKASSVGFRNLKHRRLDPTKDKEEMQRDGYDLKTGYAAELTHNALHELSAVPVGSNPNALAKAIRAAIPEAHRGLLYHDAAKMGEITEAWITQKLELLRAALAPAPVAPVVVVAPTSVVPDEGLAELEAAAGTMETELDRALEAEPLIEEPTPTELRTLIENSTNAMRQEMKELRELFQALSTEIKSSRGAATGGGHASPLPAPAPSHLDVLLAENVDALARMSSLFAK